MRYFKVLNCPQSKVIQKHVRFKTDSGMASRVEYREVQAGEEGWWPGAYGHEKIKEGDVLPLDGRLADKASRNDAFEEVDKPVKKAKKKAKKNAA